MQRTIIIGYYALRLLCLYLSNRFAFSIYDVTDGKPPRPGRFSPSKTGLGYGGLVGTSVGNNMAANKPQEPPFKSLPTQLHE
jgi:hypothetical protein